MPGSRRTFPSEPHSRRLGTGSSSGGGERLLRTQLVIAVVLGFTILAVLLYLWRRPSGTEHERHAAVAAASASATAPITNIVRTKVEPPRKVVPLVTLGTVEHVQCGSSARLSGEGNLCDTLPFFEQMLSKAITDSVDCAPKLKEESRLNYVLSVDFRKKDVHLYAGRSGTLRGKKAKATIACVKRALTAPTWETVTHQYRHYLIAILATYPAADAGEALPNFQ